MKRTMVLLFAVLVSCTAAMAYRGYDYEAHQRPLWRTVSVDEPGRTTNVFVHSRPYTWVGPDGTKNPIQGLRLLYVTSDINRFVTAQPKGADYRIQVSTAIIDGESNERLGERIAREAKDDYSLTNGNRQGDFRDLEILDAGSARYESDRVLTACFVVTRFRGYDDDEQLFVNAGKPNPTRLYNEFTKVEVTLPEHEYRYLWVPEGRLESKSSEWVTDPYSEANMQLELLIQATFDTRPLLQVRERKIPEAIRIYSAHGLLWEGAWGESGKVYRAYDKVDSSLLYQKRSTEARTYYEGIIPTGH